MKQNKEESSRKRVCFVVCPIGEDDSDIRIHSDWLFEEVISCAFVGELKDFKIVRSDKIITPGLIDGQIIKLILDADLVIADLSFINPNVFYEIGIRHSLNKPIIHMHLDKHPIPFDVKTFRSINFSLKRPSDIREARSTLTQFIEEALSPDYRPENPVSATLERIEFNKTAAPQDKILLEQIDNLSRRIAALESPKYSRKSTASLSDYLGRVYFDRIEIVSSLIDIFALGAKTIRVVCNIESYPDTPNFSIEKIIQSYAHSSLDVTRNKNQKSISFSSILTPQQLDNFVSLTHKIEEQEDSIGLDVTYTISSISML